MSSSPRKRTRKTLASVAGLALLLGPLAACSDDEGTDKAQPVAAIADLATDGGTTAVALDPATLKALTGLGVKPAPFGTAKLKAGSIIFPITGGNVRIYEKDAVDRYVQGQVQHFGSGLSLSAGGTTVTVGNFNVDPTASRVYGDVAVDGKVVANSIYLLRLDGRTLMTPRFEGDTAVLEGSGVFLSAAAAGLLNKTFNVDALSGDTKIGVAKITANVPADA